jgi:hypothetical protein
VSGQRPDHSAGDKDSTQGLPHPHRMLARKPSEVPAGQQDKRRSVRRGRHKLLRLCEPVINVKSHSDGWLIPSPQTALLHGAVAWSDQPSRPAPPARPEAVRQPFRWPVYRGSPEQLRSLTRLLGARRGRSQCNTAFALITGIASAWTTLSSYLHREPTGRKP